MQNNENYLFHDDSSNKTAAFVFDDIYKNAAHKKQFENNPKFSYFNAIIKMKSKLANENKTIYDRVFSGDISFNDFKDKKIPEDALKNATESKFFKFSKHDSQD